MRCVVLSVPARLQYKLCRAFALPFLFCAPGCCFSSSRSCHVCLPMFVLVLEWQNETTPVLILKKDQEVAHACH